MACTKCNPCGVPFLLRLALAVVFIWAGAIKVAGSKPVKGEDAAILANMGVLTPTTSTVNTPGSPAAPATTPAAPSKDAKPSGSSAAPNPEPKTHSSRPVPSEPIAAANVPVLMTVATPQGAKTYTAEDFPEEQQVKPLYGIAIMLKKAAATTDAEGKPVKPIWPDFLAHDRWPVHLAWLCALTELVGGTFVLLGVLTRLSAFGLACVMCVAMWLTQIGPAFASGNGFLGFLPNHPWTDGFAWATFQTQVVMLLLSLAVVGMGAGRMSVDRVVFPPPPPPAKPKPENATPA
jgi:uncharacterized membrane protein YphA (DoxX/SURF4 family)